MRPGATVSDARSSRDEAILRAAMPLFGRFGFRKTSVEDLARAAGLSKQGLYLRFSSKEEIFVAAMRRYLDEGLLLVDRALEQEDVLLAERLIAAMDAWFGRHLVTFSRPEVFDVIEAGNRLSGPSTDRYKIAFQERLAAAIRRSPEFDIASSTVSPRELANVFFIFGLTWKEGWSRSEFVDALRLCVSACLPRYDRK